jgi:hypothetical protein
MEEEEETELEMASKAEAEYSAATPVEDSEVETEDWEDPTAVMEVEAGMVEMEVVETQVR